MRIVILALSVFLSTISLHLQAASYYFDSIEGDDAYNGLSANTAWRTLGNLTQMNLTAGDRLLFRSGSLFNELLELNAEGNANNLIEVSSYGVGEPPVVAGINLQGSWWHISKVSVDSNGADRDAVRVRGVEEVTFENVSVSNGTKDGFDIVGARNFTIRDCEIYNFLAGSFTDQKDAHGIAISNADGVLIDSCEIHHVSGDAIQVDPNRVPGEVSNNITIANSKLWTGPLVESFNTGWSIGQVPGENALDTKVLKTGFENEQRMYLTLQNIVAYGWSKGNYISNRAAFNLKEKINAVIDGVTVYNSEIAFRLRGGLGNAMVSIRNAVIYETDTAFRIEDNIEGLHLQHATIGSNVGDVVRKINIDGVEASWLFENNISLVNDSQADALGFQTATASDFQHIAEHNYRLRADSAFVDSGNRSDVVTDLTGASRDQQPDAGAYEFLASSVPNAPVINTP